MIAQDFDYVRPKTLDEALSLVADGTSKLLAGGMSLIPLMKLRLAAPDRLVDVSRIPELNYIREGDGVIHVGATTTHYQVESSALLRSRCGLVAEAAAHIGDPQVRNRGTIGGSVAHADPAADYPAALFALEANVVLAGPSGARTVSFEEFIIDTFTTALEPGEMVREVVVPVEHAGAGFTYQKMVQPASGYAVVGIAVRLRKSGGKLANVRVGITGLGPKAFRARNVEQALEGTSGSASEIQQASALVTEGIDANTDIHASSDYRKHLARVYTMRALAVAISRAQ